MKTTSFLAAAAAFALAGTAAVSAAEPIHSPRGKANQIRVVPGPTTDQLDRSIKPVSPRHAALMRSVRKVEGTTEVARAGRLPTVSPRLLANEPWRAREFQVAPLK